MSIDVMLETDRLRLRRLHRDDADNLVALEADPEVMRYVGGGAPTPREVIVERVLPRLLSCYARYGGLGFFAAEEKQGGRFIGWFHLRPSAEGSSELELGYRLRRDAWGVGYATEGACALVRIAFVERGAQRVSATALAANARSLRVLEKAGLRPEERYAFHSDNPAYAALEGAPAVRCALSREQWLAAGAPSPGDTPTSASPA